MSTDKTLADVQPGGRVRLGDQLPPLPPLPYPNYPVSKTGLQNNAYTASQMTDYARAALSAQPSPGGQGDALVALVSKWRNEASAYDDQQAKETGYDVDWTYDAKARALDRAAAELKAALAARQPVGEHDQEYLESLDRALEGVIDQRDRYHEVADELAGHIAAITGVDIGEHSSSNCPWQNAIEAAEEYKPALTVGLEQFREAVELFSAHSERHGSLADCQYADRLLALIDKAVVNG